MRGKTERNAERRERGCREQNGRWWRRMRQSHRVPRTVLGESELPGQQEEDNFKGERDFFFPLTGILPRGRKL